MYLELNELPGRLTELAGETSRLELELGDEGAIEDVKALAAHPGLNNVVSLQMVEFPLEEEEAHVLFGSPNLTNLESLTLGDGQAREYIVEGLVGANVPSLKFLEFRGYMVGGVHRGELAMLGASNLGTQLEVLRLFNCGMDADAAYDLASSAWPNLRELQLGGGNYSHNEIGAEGAVALASSQGFAQLEMLDLSYNYIGDEGLERFCKTRGFKNLRALHLDANNITHDSFKHLTVHELSDQIVTWGLSHNDLNDRGATYLAQSAPERIEVLWFYHNPLGDDGVRILSNAPMSRGIKMLNLMQTEMGDEGGRALVESEYLGQLETLYLGLNPKLSPEMGRRLVSRFGDAIKDQRHLKLAD